jgi:hypothetical protein
LIVIVESITPGVFVVVLKGGSWIGPSLELNGGRGAPAGTIEVIEVRIRSLTPGLIE